MQKLKTTTLALLVAAASAHAQLKTPQPSPLQTVTQAFGLGEIKIEYSRPSVKGRVIFGDLVPYGQIWRTGANQSTKITFGEDMSINGNKIEPGTYALYTVPNATEWEIMFYKDLNLGGNVSDYKKENEVMRFKVKPLNVNDKMETFTIAVNNILPNSCSLDLLWDKTKVSIPVTTDYDDKVMKQIEKEMGDKRPYYQAANYYYENNKDLNKALEWINKAVENNPKAYWVLHTKAKIQYKLNDLQGAAKTAEQSLAIAKEQGDNSYVKMNEKIIADVKKSSK
jgi:hypothetical protein